MHCHKHYVKSLTITTYEMNYEKVVYKSDIFLDLLTWRKTECSREDKIIVILN